MKGIKFFVMTILAAAMPMLISSCKPNNQPDDTTGGGGTGAATIVGSWELVDAQKSNSEGALWVLEDREGQEWVFDATKLTVGKDACDYTLAGTTLTTSYASYYEANAFTVQTLTAEDLTLLAVHDESDKVGKRTITYTLKFKRMAK